LVDCEEALEVCGQLMSSIILGWIEGTLFVMSLISSLLILVMSVPRMMGDLVMAQIAK
jgi:hypothetical protein